MEAGAYRNFAVASVLQKPGWPEQVAGGRGRAVTLLDSALCFDRDGRSATVQRDVQRSWRCGGAHRIPACSQSSSIGRV